MTGQLESQARQHLEKAASNLGKIHSASSYLFSELKQFVDNECPIESVQKDWKGCRSLVDETLQVPSSIVVCGWCSSGVTSFVNELLEGRPTLPTDPMEAGSRLVRLQGKYPLPNVNHPCHCVYDLHGPRDPPENIHWTPYETENDFPDRRTILNAQYRQQVCLYVPNHPLIGRDGTSILDYPSFDRETHRDVHFIRHIARENPPLLIYIYDDGPGFSMTDNRTCKDLLDMCSEDTQLILVSNKSETDQVAQEHDRGQSATTDPDSDLEASLVNPEDLRKIALDYVHNYMASVTMDQVHAISTRVQRELRLGLDHRRSPHEVNVLRGNYEELLETIARNLSNTNTRLLNTAFKPLDNLIQSALSLFKGDLMKQIQRGDDLSQFRTRINALSDDYKELLDMVRPEETVAMVHNQVTYEQLADFVGRLRYLDDIDVSRNHFSVGLSVRQGEQVFINEIQYKLSCFIDDISNFLRASLLRLVANGAFGHKRQTIITNIDQIIKDAQSSDHNYPGSLLAQLNRLRHGLTLPSFERGLSRAMEPVVEMIKAVKREEFRGKSLNSQSLTRIICLILARDCILQEIDIGAAWWEVITQLRATLVSSLTTIQETLAAFEHPQEVEFEGRLETVSRLNELRQRARDMRDSD